MVSFFFLMQADMTTVKIQMKFKTTTARAIVQEKTNQIFGQPNISGW